jgi:hypothetical protein
MGGTLAPRGRGALPHTAETIDARCADDRRPAWIPVRAFARLHRMAWYNATPPDGVVQCQAIALVSIIVRLVSRPHIVDQRDKAGAALTLGDAPSTTTSGGM